MSNIIPILPVNLQPPNPLHHCLIKLLGNGSKRDDNQQMKFLIAKRILVVSKY